MPLSARCLCAPLALAHLALVAPAAAKDARSTEAKAKYVFAAISRTDKAFTPASLQRPGQPLTPEIQAAAGRELDAFNALATSGVKACLTEDDVYQLGWFSGLEDAAFDSASGCHLRKGAALPWGGQQTITTATF